MGANASRNDTVARPVRANRVATAKELPYCAGMAAEASVHPTAVLDEGARVGAGTRIWHFSHVMAGAELGMNCVVGQNVFIGGGVRIGDGVKIQNNVSVYDGVILESDVFCGPSVVFTNVINPRAFIERKTEYRPTRICRGASLGANSTIICGCTIGEYAFVGAGAVVTADVRPHALVVGVPARERGWICRCGITLATPGPDPADDTMSCPGCKSRYLLETKLEASALRALE